MQFTKHLRFLALTLLLPLAGCHSLTPEERAALLQFSLKAGDAVLVKATK
jgi:predicted component of type VI protein secretion system